MKPSRDKRFIFDKTYVDGARKRGLEENNGLLVSSRRKMVGLDGIHYLVQYEEFVLLSIEIVLGNFTLSFEIQYNTRMPERDNVFAYTPDMVQQYGNGPVRLRSALSKWSHWRGDENTDRRIAEARESGYALHLAQEAFFNADKRIVVMNGPKIGDNVFSLAAVAGIQEIDRKQGRAVPLDIYVHPAHAELYAGLASDTVRVIPVDKGQVGNVVEQDARGNVFVLDGTYDGLNGILLGNVVRFDYPDATVTAVNSYIRHTVLLPNGFQAGEEDAAGRFARPLEMLLGLPLGTLPDIQPELPLVNREAILQELGIDKPGIMWIHTGSTDDKYYRPRQMAAVFREIRDTYPEYPLYVVVGPDAPDEHERSDIEYELRRAGFDEGDVTFLEGSLAELATAASAMKLAIAGDSGLGHITAAVGTEVISLYSGNPGVSPQEWQSSIRQHPLVPERNPNIFFPSTVSDISEERIFASVQALLAA